jgi:radical SAM superfamily enzyme YgiQ (UPF0313 family)
MPDLLLTHGYFLYEDPKEMQIMKPYAPLGILYLCSHLRQRGFDVEVFDTTFSNRETLFRHLQTAKPSTLGVYANLMTRSNVVEIIRVGREAGWRVIVGGPEPGAYAQEFLESGADFVVSGEGESTMAATRPEMYGSRRLPAQHILTMKEHFIRILHACRLLTLMHNPGPPVKPSICIAMSIPGGPTISRAR